MVAASVSADHDTSLMKSGKNASILVVTKGAIPSPVLSLNLERRTEAFQFNRRIL